MSHMPEQHAISEQVPPGAPAVDYFGALIRLAEWNNKDGDYAWFKPNPKTAQGAGIIVQRVVRIQFPAVRETFAPGPSTPEPAWLDEETAKPVKVEYHHWTLGSGQDPESVQGVLKPNIGKRTYTPRASLNPAHKEAKQYRNVLVPSVCYAFGKRAASFADLAHYTHTYLTWMERQQQSVQGLDMSTLPDAFLGRSLRLGTDLHDYGTAETNPFLAELGRLSPDHPGYDYMVEALTAGMIKLVNGQPLQSDMYIHKNIDRSTLLEAIHGLDSQNMLARDFWISAGVASGLATRDYDILELLHDKLAGEEDPRSIVESREGLDIDFIARIYMTDLFKEYAADPRRDQGVLQKIIKTLTPQGKDHISRTQLIEVANNLTRGWNSRVEDPSGRYGLLDRHSYRDVSDALLRVLSITYRPDAPKTVQRQLAEEDRLHFDIVEALMNTCPGQTRKVTLKDVKLRYPYANAEQVLALRDQLNAGRPIHAIRAAARQNKMPLRPVSRFAMKQSGYGLLG